MQLGVGCNGRVTLAPRVHWHNGVLAELPSRWVAPMQVTNSSRVGRLALNQSTCQEAEQVGYLLGRQLSCASDSPGMRIATHRGATMIFPARLSKRFVGQWLFASCAAWTMLAVQARAETTAGGSDWSIGAAATDDGSIGTAATVDVPAPQRQATSIQYSTDAPSAATPGPAPNTFGAPPAPAPASAQPNGVDEYQDTDPSALDVFRPDLDPYGRWVDDSHYGRVWIPDTNYVGSDFAPYVSNGHWALDADNNWTWESDYPFGWVVFHYGRWAFIDGLGWSWVPGRSYAPAWVVWRVPTDDYAYVGWAPAPPTFAWYSTGLFWLDYYPPLPFVFCPSSYVFYPGFGAYMVRDRYFAATLVRHSVWYSTAPVYGRGYVSPSVQRARVPAQAVPAQRVTANPQAAAFSRPSASPRVANGSYSGAGSSRLTSSSWGHGPSGMLTRSTAMPGATRPSTFGGNPTRYSTSTGFPNTFGTRAPVNRPAQFTPRQTQSLGFTNGSSYGGYSSHSVPSAAIPATSYSSHGYSVPSRTLSTPSFSAPGTSSYSTPRFSAPSTSSYSTPRFSAPSASSYSAPRFSAPSSSSYSAPRSSFGGSFSAPSHSSSSPSFSAPRSFGGGGHSGGGRH